MDRKQALKAILGISIAGIIFSGYLSLNELFGELCAIGQCSAQLFGITVSVYGLLMFIALLIISVLGLKAYR